MFTPENLNQLEFASYGKADFTGSVNEGVFSKRKRLTLMPNCDVANYYVSDSDVLLKPIVGTGAGALWVDNGEDSERIFLLSAPVVLRAGVRFTPAPLGCIFSCDIFFNTLEEKISEKNLAALILLDKQIISAIYAVTFQERQSKFRFEGEYHPYYELIYVDSGCADCMLDGESFRLSQGDLTVYDKNRFHSASVPERSSIAFLDIAFDADLPLLGALNGVIIKVDDFQLRLIAALLEETKRTDTYYNGAVFSLTNLLLISLLRSVTEKQSVPRQFKGNPIQNRLVAECVRYINEHPQERLTLDDLAHRFLVSNSGLSKTFKRIVGKNISDYIIEVKLACAKTMMLNGICSFSEIANDLGFCSLSYFSYKFKKVYSVSPRNFCKSLNADINK